jgi:hypothetical protein
MFILPFTRSVHVRHAYVPHTILDPEHPVAIVHADISSLRDVPHGVHGVHLLAASSYSESETRKINLNY